jgi:hypothetical protein
MNPFDQAPATPPVSFDPPNPLIQPAPRRGRMVLAAVAAAGLMGVGLVGVSQFASADRPDVDPNASGVALATPEPQDDSDDSENDAGDDVPQVGGQIVIDTGDGEPIVIDLEGGTVDGQPFEQIAECIGLPALGEGRLFEFEPGEFESMFEEFESMFEEFGEFEHFGEPGVVGPFGAGGTHVTVMGPDGLQVIDLGEGDGSVTITQQNGELTIVTDGDAKVSEIEDLLGAIEFPDLESWDLGEFDFEQMFEDFPLDRFERMLPDDFEGFDFELPTDIQGCLGAAGNG